MTNQIIYRGGLTLAQRQALTLAADEIRVIAGDDGNLYEVTSTNVSLGGAVIGSAGAGGITVQDSTTVEGTAIQTVNFGANLDVTVASGVATIDGSAGGLTDLNSINALTGSIGSGTLGVDASRLTGTAPAGTVAEIEDISNVNITMRSALATLPNFAVESSGNYYDTAFGRHQLNLGVSSSTGPGSLASYPIGTHIIAYQVGTTPSESDPTTGMRWSGVVVENDASNPFLGNHLGIAIDPPGRAYLDGLDPSNQITEGTIQGWVLRSVTTSSAGVLTSDRLGSVSEQDPIDFIATYTNTRVVTELPNTRGGLLDVVFLIAADGSNGIGVYRRTANQGLDSDWTLMAEVGSGLATVSTDVRITGDGSSGSPLGIANDAIGRAQLDFEAGTDESNGRVISLSATNELGTTTLPNAPAINFNGGTPTLESGVTAAEIRTLIGVSDAADAPAIIDTAGTPSLATGITAEEVRTLIGAGTGGGVQSGATFPTSPTVGMIFVLTADIAGPPAFEAGVYLRTPLGDWQPLEIDSINTIGPPGTAVEQTRSKIVYAQQSNSFWISDGTNWHLMTVVLGNPDFTTGDEVAFDTRVADVRTRFVATVSNTYEDVRIEAPAMGDPIPTAGFSLAPETNSSNQVAFITIGLPNNTLSTAFMNSLAVGDRIVTATEGRDNRTFGIIASASDLNTTNRTVRLTLECAATPNGFILAPFPPGIPFPDVTNVTAILGRANDIRPAERTLGALPDVSITADNTHFTAQTGGTTSVTNLMGDGDYIIATRVLELIFVSASDRAPYVEGTNVAFTASTVAQADIPTNILFTGAVTSSRTDVSLGEVVEITVDQRYETFFDQFNLAQGSTTERAISGATVGGWRAWNFVSDDVGVAVFNAHGDLFNQSISDFQARLTVGSSVSVDGTSVASPNFIDGTDTNISALGNLVTVGINANTLVPSEFFTGGTQGTGPGTRATSIVAGRLPVVHSDTTEWDFQPAIGSTGVTGFLGTPTTPATQFLRGDGTWEIPRDDQVTFTTGFDTGQNVSHTYSGVTITLGGQSGTDPNVALIHFASQSDAFAFFALSSSRAGNGTTTRAITVNYGPTTTLAFPVGTQLEPAGGNDLAILNRGVVVQTPGPALTNQITPLDFVIPASATLPIHTTGNLFDLEGTGGIDIDIDPATSTITVDGSGVTGGSSTLNALTDVNIFTPTDGNVLTYNATQSQWFNRTPASLVGDTILGNHSDVTITSVANNNTLQFDSTSTDWVNRPLIGSPETTVVTAPGTPEIVTFNYDHGLNNTVFLSWTISAPTLDGTTITGTQQDAIDGVPGITTSGSFAEIFFGTDAEFIAGLQACLDAGATRAGVTNPWTVTVGTANQAVFTSTAGNIVGNITFTETGDFGDRFTAGAITITQQGTAPTTSTTPAITGFLGTPTATTTQFLRGDGTWATPASGPSGGGTTLQVWQVTNNGNQDIAIATTDNTRTLGFNTTSPTLFGDNFVTGINTLATGTYRFDINLALGHTGATSGANRLYARAETTVGTTAYNSGYNYARVRTPYAGTSINDSFLHTVTGATETFSIVVRVLADSTAGSGTIRMSPGDARLSITRLS